MPDAFRSTRTFETLSFRNLEASPVSFLSTWAEISSAANCFLMLGQSIFTFLLSSLMTAYGTWVLSPVTSSCLLPMNRFTEKNVFVGLTTACLFAICPISISPVFVYATTLGVVLCPSAFVMIVGFPPSIAATALFVVPRSIPTTCLHFSLAITWSFRAFHTKLRSRTTVGTFSHFTVSLWAIFAFRRTTARGWRLRWPMKEDELAFNPAIDTLFAARGAMMMMMMIALLLLLLLLSFACVS